VAAVPGRKLATEEMHLRTCILPALLLAIVGRAGADTITIYGDRADTEVYHTGIFGYDPGGNAGESGVNGGFDYSMVYVFQLPSLSPGQIISAADFSFYDEASGSSYNTDLYGLTWRASSTVLASDWYSGPNDPNNTLIEHNIVPPSFTFSGRITTSSTGDTGLASFLNAQYAAGAVGGDFVFLRLSTNTANVPNANVNFYYTADWAYTLANAQGNLSFWQSRYSPLLDVTTVTASTPEPAGGMAVISGLAGFWITRRKLMGPRKP
jgi:hypothetical protein